MLFSYIIEKIINPLLVSGLIFLIPVSSANAELATGQDPLRPSISIIIDDIGYLLEAGTRAIELPGAIAFAFLPHTPYAIELAKLAHSYNKEIMLHAPMQPADASKNRLLGPGALTMEMSEQQIIKTLQADLASIPHVTGINNHMEIGRAHV